MAFADTELLFSDASLAATLTGGGTEARLRFREFHFSRLPNGSCEARVILAAPDGTLAEGTARATWCEFGALRLAADATLSALAGFVGRRPFELLGVKQVRVFDATLVVVALSHDGSLRDDAAGRLLGSYLTESDPLRGAALAVLNATNRVLGNHVARSAGSVVP